MSQIESLQKDIESNFDELLKTHHCFDGVRSLCGDDSCPYNPSQHPSKECDEDDVSWETQFIWSFTKRFGCLSFCKR